MPQKGIFLDFLHRFLLCTFVNAWQLVWIVELEGIEPSSKRGINELSTCVVSSWFLCCGRPETTNRGLSL